MKKLIGLFVLTAVVCFFGTKLWAYEPYDGMSLSGSLYGEYRWMAHKGLDNHTDSQSDLYLRKFELSVEANLTDWATANVVLNSEYIGDTLNGEDDKVVVDEATLTLQPQEHGVYIVMGKRTQPFGVFENHLITDPLTQDAYETKVVGLTAGVVPFEGLDLSVTAYKGSEQMNHLIESGILGDALQSSNTEVSDEVNSFVVALQVEPIKERLFLSGAYLSEPGSGKRNETLNLSMTFVPAFVDGLRFDMEIMKALKRQVYAPATKPYKETIWSLSLAYEFVLKRRQTRGSGLFTLRRAHTVSEPFEIAIRYEHLDDDSLAKDLGTYTLKDRYSIGARYSFYNDETAGVNIFLATEYRYTDYRTSNTPEDNNQELYLRVGMDF